MKKKQYEDDDGRQIADMSGVRSNLMAFWFVPKHRRSRIPKHMLREESKQEQVDLPPITKAESRAMMFQAMFASLLIALVFIAGAALFILFCIYIWFK